MTRHSMATEIGSELFAELTRVIECPYPASLSILADLLPRVNDYDIRACIRNRSSCAVTKLATLVCEALPLWAYTLGVLQHLCLSPEFRDRLLVQDAGFLNAVLTKANSSQREFDNYADLCVLILSRPLPESVSLPASAQSFFLRVFERATQTPDVSTLRPVYCMLNGACRQLLRLLSSEARHQFDRELCHILSSNGTGQNSMLLLWCFGIVLLAEHAGEASELQNSDAGFGQLISTPTHDKQWQTASGRKLFGSTNGLHKTLNLTYLSVIWATKGDVGVSDTEAVEGIRIAIKTLESIGHEARIVWPTSSALAKNIFPKLPSKILRSGISPAIQFEALCFYGMISEANSLPLEIVAQYEACLKTIVDLDDAEPLGQNLSTSLPLFAAQLQEGFISTLLSEGMDACVSTSASHQLSNLITLTDALSSVSSDCTPLRAKMLIALSSSVMQGKLRNLIEVNFAKEHAICHTYADSLRRDAVAAMIAMLLNLAISAQSGEPVLPRFLTSALINKQKNLPYIARQCAHQLNVPNGPSISLFQQHSTPFSGQHLQDWRDRLKSELESQNFYQCDSIVRSVAQICQDLESRCSTIEEPLRREQARSKELEERVEQLGEQVASLESQAADDRFHLDGLADENSTIAEEKDKLLKKLDSLKIELAGANQRGHEALLSAQETFKNNELEFRSTILTHEENYSVQTSELNELNSTVRQLRDSLEHSENERRTISSQYEQLQIRFDAAEKQLEEEQGNVLGQSKEVSRLDSRCKHLEDQLQSTESELEVIIGRLSDLQVSHQELIQSAEETLREAELKHVGDVEAVTARAEEEQTKLTSQLEEAQRNGHHMTETYNETRRALQVLQNSASELESRIQELTELCTEQEDELGELRTLRRNVLASMGLATPNPLAAGRSTSRSQKNERDPQTPHEPRQHRRRKSAVNSLERPLQANTGTQSFGSTAVDNANDPSLVPSSDESQGGSSPKRPRTRPSIKMAAEQTPFTKKPIFSSRSASAKLSPAKRSVLRRLSPSRRHTTVGFAHSESDEEQQTDEGRSSRMKSGNLQGEEQESTIDEFLAGTPFTPGAFAAGTGRVPEDDEDTMTEL